MKEFLVNNPAAYQKFVAKNIFHINDTTLTVSKCSKKEVLYDVTNTLILEALPCHYNNRQIGSFFKFSLITTTKNTETLIQ